MANLSTKATGQTILAADHNEIYNLLKGTVGAGEPLTLVYNAAGVISFQPSSDPSAGTELFSIKNNAGTVQMALSSDGKVYAADGVVGTPGVTFEADKDTGLYRTTTNTVDIAAGGSRIATFDANGLTVQTGALKIGAATTKQMVSRYLNNAALTVTNAVGGSYVDFGGSFTTSVTTLAGDQVCIRVQGMAGKATANYGSIVVDRGGTKLPTAGGAQPSVLIYFGVTGALLIPFAFEYWDTPGAGTFTYKPQAFTSDGNTFSAGGGNNCQYLVEVWR